MAGRFWRMEDALLEFVVEVSDCGNDYGDVVGSDCWIERSFCWACEEVVGDDVDDDLQYLPESKCCKCRKVRAKAQEYQLLLDEVCNWGIKPSNQKERPNDRLPSEKAIRSPSEVWKCFLERRGEESNDLQCEYEND